MSTVVHSTTRCVDIKVYDVYVNLFMGGFVVMSHVPSA